MAKPNKKDAKRANVSLLNVEILFGKISRRDGGRRSLKAKVREVLHRSSRLKAKNADKAIGLIGFFGASNAKNQKKFFPKNIRKGKVVTCYATSWRNPETKKHAWQFAMALSDSSNDIAC